MSSTFKGVFGTIVNVWTAKELDALLGTQNVMWDLHLKPVELQICCKIAKLAGLIPMVKAGQSACCLPSFFQWLIMSSSVCPLPKLRKWRLGKHSVTTGSVMLMFCHLVIAWKARSVMLMFCCLVIAWKVIWNRRICEKILSQVNYALSSGYALETTEPE